MQQVPNSEPSGGRVVSNHEAHRWSRVPRVSLLRNKNDQRVPLYLDQTVPVWSTREHTRGSSTNASPSSKTPADGMSNREEEQGRGHGVQKSARRWLASSQTAWFRRVLRASSTEDHAFNVSEILQGCSISSSNWSGIEQDLFTCTSVDPKVFVVPTAEDFVTNKKSKSSNNPLS
ncbi:uncharacterized protein [Physcomitrium patens]|uniref:Uncharacterized protein n=1 Tax=Physcomitrium patens TaxID=3218 RepID=A0A2K1IZ22_PHYPA|nr:uncharacterized protein LOC112295777 [Physcomitrium patens]PNR34532.1 hypothetical protein PHYPA_024349 [Physcomitrium patens]|eukprot:XP_024403481.1 uncharacterized protein LOC112295777 [Physcomitrella patens]